MIHHHTKTNKCPNCGYEFDCASPLDDNPKAPEEGDLTLCFKCAAVLIFTEDQGIRNVTPEDMAKVPLRVQIDIAVAKNAIKQKNAEWNARRN